MAADCIHEGFSWAGCRPIMLSPSLSKNLFTASWQPDLKPQKGLSLFLTALSSGEFQFGRSWLQHSLLVHLWLILDCQSTIAPVSSALPVGIGLRARSSQSGCLQKFHSNHQEQIPASLSEGVILEEWRAWWPSSWPERQQGWEREKQWDWILRMLSSTQMEPGLMPTASQSNPSHYENVIRKPIILYVNQS